MQIVLASKSPRRRELFSIISRHFIAIEADVDESIVEGLSAKELAERLAKLKCEKAVESYRNSVVIGCDTLVELDGAIFGKPVDREDAVRMLRALSGNSHNVHTGVCVALPGDSFSFSCMTKVTFNEMDDEEIREYVDSKDPFDKAGSYGIQGMAARYIKGIEGDYFNVLGLPISMLYRELRDRKIV